MTASLHFATIAVLLLGVERCLYAYVFNFPQDFIKRCKTGTFGSAIQREPVYWKSFMHLGMCVKVFQFSVIAYDLFIQNQIGVNSLSRFILGATLLAVGQVLNMAAFQSLGCMGVYYGYELGYKVPRITSFPYNLGFSDPQYWGVVFSIFGLYILLHAQSFLIPTIELFWYLLSMKVLEHSRNGRLIIQSILGQHTFK